MASIQILELRPVECELEDLSYDITDIIRGGGLEEALTIAVECYRNLAKGIFDGLPNHDLFGDFAECMLAATLALYT